MDRITSMSIDIETFSDIDLTKSGVYRYSESPAFEIMLFGVSVNAGAVTVYDLASGDTIPDEILKALVDDNVKKWAFNASFERICLSRYLQRNYPNIFAEGASDDESSTDYLRPESWCCDLVLSAYNGLPLSLEKAGAALGLDEQKMKEGRELIAYFCKPCKPTQANGGRTRNLLTDAPDKWELFKKYNKRDVDVEISIHDRLKKYAVPDSVWDEYHIDQEINDRGIMIDLEFVQQAIHLDAVTKERLTKKMQDITGLENPNSVIQLNDWFSDHGLQMDSLSKKDVAAAIKDKDTPPELKEVLILRQMLAKSSVKKYIAMINSVCKDGRCRGMFFFYGANRSGRWAGRLIQLQNLPQNKIPELESARTLVKTGDFEMIDMLYKNVPDLLSQLIRTSFIPKPGMKYIVSDFAAIEARVLSYLAGEKWRSRVFANNGDIYCESASKMFKVPVVKHGINGHLRQKGKIAELALGYGGSVGALKSMGALEMGLTEEELQPLVDSWRDANPNIVKYWWDVDKAVKKAVKQHLSAKVGSVEFIWKSGMLFIKLPSGRRLSYVKPKMTLSQYGTESVTYYGTDSQKKWGRIESYGPKFVENIVQAISRDILCNSIKTLRHCSIVGHVHDELIIECDPRVDVNAVCEQMGRSPAWMPDILLRADGYSCQCYQKDN